MENICSMCNYNARSKLNLVRHCLTRHKFEKVFHARCGVEKCFYTTTSYNALKIHVNRKHGIVTNEMLVNLSQEVLETNNNNDIAADVEIPQTICSEDRIIQRDEFLLGKFLLNLETSHRVSKAGVDEISIAAESMVQNVVRDYAKSLLQNLPENLRDVVKQTMTTTNLNISAHKLSSNKKRKKFYKEFCNFLEPTPVYLGEHYTNQRKSSQRCLKKEYGYVIPFKKTLELLLNQKEFFNYCTRNCS